MSDLSGKRVCVAKGTTSLHRIRQIDPPPVVVSVVNWADCLVAMQQREIDAVSTDDSILAGLVEEDPYLHIVGPNMATQPYGIGVNLTTPNWCGSSTAPWSGSAGTARGTRCTASG